MKSRLTALAVLFTLAAALSIAAPAANAAVKAKAPTPAVTTQTQTAVSPANAESTTGAVATGNADRLKMKKSTQVANNEAIAIGATSSPPAIPQTLTQRFGLATALTSNKAKTVSGTMKIAVATLESAMPAPSVAVTVKLNNCTQASPEKFRRGNEETALATLIAATQAGNKIRAGSKNRNC
jgi:hypothetical protein